MLLELSIDELSAYATSDEKLSQKVEEAKALLATKNE